jgi:hypothetical protein
MSIERQPRRGCAGDAPGYSSEAKILQIIWWKVRKLAIFRRLTVSPRVHLAGNTINAPT